MEDDEEALLAARRADHAVAWLRRAILLNGALVLWVLIRAWTFRVRRWYAPDAGWVVNAFVGFCGALGDALRHAMVDFGIWTASLVVALFVTLGVARGHAGFERDRVQRHLGALWLVTCGIPTWYVVFGGLMEAF